MSSLVAEEWIIDATSCAAALLSSTSAVRALCDEAVLAYGLTKVQEPLWHAFPSTAAGPGGVTGMYLLSESHLAVHTWPERRAALLSLGTCRPGVPAAFSWQALLQRHLHAKQVVVRRVERVLPPIVENPSLTPAPSLRPGGPRPGLL